jgi:hypothetical protein
MVKYVQESYKPGDHNINLHSCENLKPQIISNTDTCKKISMSPGFIAMEHGDYNLVGLHEKCLYC